MVHLAGNPVAERAVFDGQGLDADVPPCWHAAKPRRSASARVDPLARRSAEHALEQLDLSQNPVDKDSVDAVSHLSRLQLINASRCNWASWPDFLTDSGTPVTPGCDGGGEFPCHWRAPRASARSRRIHRLGARNRRGVGAPNR